MAHKAHSCKMPHPDPRLFDADFKSRTAGALRHCWWKRFVPNSDYNLHLCAWHVLCKLRLLLDRHLDRWGFLSVVQVGALGLSLRLASRA